MKKILLVNTLLLPFLLNAQISIRGIVTEQNSGNKPVVGVQIKALGANPEVSDNSGLFLLVFGAKKPGDRVIVSEIKKKGYEIVNKNEVDSWLISSNPNQRTKVVMCPEGLIAENTAKNYAISLKALTDGYNKRINALQEQFAKALIDAKTYGEQAKTLSDQFTNQQNQLEELADKFARENFDDCSAIQKKAFEAFKQGNIEEAIRILETVDSDAEIAKAKQQKEKGGNLINEGKSMQSEADSIIQQNITKLMFQGDLYATNYQINDAEKTYYKAILADSTNFKNILTYINFVAKAINSESKLVHKWYNTALNLAKNEHDSSLVLSKLGVQYFYEGLYDQSIVTLTKLVNVYNSLVKTNNNIYIKEFAISLSNLACAYEMTSQYDKAELNFIKAINILKSLPKDTLRSYNDIISISKSLSKDHISILGGANNTISYDDGGFDFFAEGYTKFLQNEKESIIIMNRKNSKILQSLYSNLAYLYEKTERLNDAKNNYMEAISSCTKEESNTYDIISNYKNIIRLIENSGQYDELEKYYSQIVDIYRKYSDKYPQKYNLKLALQLVKKADIQYNNKEYDKAEASYNEAINICRQLAETNTNINFKLIKYYNELASINTDNNDYKKAENNYNEAIIICKRMIELIKLDSTSNTIKFSQNKNLFDTDEYRLSLASTLNNLAYLQNVSENYEQAGVNYTESIRILKEIVNHDSSLYSDLALRYIELAHIQKVLQKYNNSESNYKEALNIYEFIRSYPDIAVTNYYLAILYLKKEQYQDAELNYQDAIRIYKDIIKLDSDNVIEYVELLSGYASLEKSIKKYDQAKIYYKEAIEIYKQLAIDNLSFNSKLVKIYNELASIDISSKNYKNASDNYDKAITICRRMVEVDPDRYYSKLANTLYNKAYFQDEMGEKELAEVNYTESINILRKLVEKDSSRYSDIALQYNMLAHTQESLQKFDQAESNSLKALNIYRELSIKDSIYIIPIANTLYLLSSVQYKCKLGNAIGNLQEAIDIFRKESDFVPDLKNDYAASLERMSFYQMLGKQFSEAEKYARMSIAENSNSNVKNLAHSLLLQGKFEEAEHYYATFKNNPEMTNQVLADFEELKKNGVYSPDFERINSFLKN